MKNSTSGSPMSLSTPSTPQDEQLGWDELTALLAHLPNDPCERFRALLSPYLDELCAPEVHQELKQHELSCAACQSASHALSTFNDHLVVSFENLEPQVSSGEAEASLHHLLAERWEELELDQLGLEDLRRETLASNDHQDQGQQRTSAKSALQIEYHPREPRSKRRVISALFSVAAAAILFAYGPNLIEVNLGEQVSKFPQADQVTSHVSLQSDAPLSQYQGVVITPRQVRGLTQPLEVKEVKSFSTSDSTSSHFAYRVKAGAREVNVDLWSWRLNHEQRAKAREALMRSPRLESISGSQGEIKILRKQPQSSLQLIEYFSGEQRYQLSAPLTGDDALLTDMVKLLLSSEAHSSP